MTNLVPAAGFNAIYQRTTIVYTIVPGAYAKLYKLYLRGDGSCIRVRNNFRSHYCHLSTNFRFPVDYASLIVLVILTFKDPVTIVRLLFTIGLMAFFDILYYLYSEHSWYFLRDFICLLLLFFFFQVIPIPNHG
jgi:hypothetical protein